MRVFGGVLVLGSAAALAGAATAALPIPVPPVPPLPPPPVTVPVPLPTPPPAPAPPPPPKAPPAPVPLPPIPKLPPPVVPATAQTTTSTASAATAAAAAAATPQASGATASGGSAGGRSASGSSGGGATGSTASGQQSSTRARVDHFSSSRRWIATTGSKRRRTTMLVFVLPHAGRVVFALKQVSPQCTSIGRFSVAGHAGLNRVPFGGRLHGRQLEPGTYSISARTASGRLVRRIKLVVVGATAPTPSELRSLRASNVCAAAARLASSGVTDTTSSGGGTLAGQPGSESQRQVNAGGFALPHPPNLDRGVLGSSVQRTVKALQPLLVALLAVAILLLGLGSLPRRALAEPRFNYLLAQHRTEIVALGATALVAVAVAFLLA